MCPSACLAEAAPHIAEQGGCDSMLLGAAQQCPPPALPASLAERSWPRCIHNADMVKFDINFDVWSDARLELQAAKFCTRNGGGHENMEKSFRFWTWKFANYVSTLPRERWVVRALNWLPEHARRVGRPAYSWDSMIQSFWRHKQIGNWRHCAHDTAFWMNQFDDFISFTEIWWTWNVDIICCACLRPERAAKFGMQVSLTHSLWTMEICLPYELPSWTLGTPNAPLATFGKGPLGRPAMSWTTKFEQFSPLKHCHDWKQRAGQWVMEAYDFIKFYTR